MQTGRKATVGGTLAGDTLSRFSGTIGKESRWIESFRILTPAGEYLDVSEQTHPDLFSSRYALPSDPRRPGFPLYAGIDSDGRYWTELMARIPLLNLAIHEVMFRVAAENGGQFENDLREFLFFMDGNTVAKERFEAIHLGGHPKPATDGHLKTGHHTP